LLCRLALPEISESELQAISGQILDGANLRRQVDGTSQAEVNTFNISLIGIVHGCKATFIGINHWFHPHQWLDIGAPAYNVGSRLLSIKVLRNRIPTSRLAGA